MLLGSSQRLQSRYKTTRVDDRQASQACIEPLEGRTLLSAGASVVTYENLLAAQFEGPHGFIWIVASETALEADVTVVGGDSQLLRAQGYSVPTVFEIAPDVKSAHLEASLVIHAYDGGGTYGEGSYRLDIDLYFTAIEPADRYSTALGDNRRSLLTSQGAQVTGSVTIESLAGEPPLPPGVPDALLSPDDGAFTGFGSVGIFQDRIVQPPHAPSSSILVTGSSVASDQFSQTPVLIEQQWNAAGGRSSTTTSACRALLSAITVLYLDSGQGSLRQAVADAAHSEIGRGADCG